MQRIACQEYAQTHPDWQIMSEVYEKGGSEFKTSADDRDALIDLRAVARAKKFDVLLVFMKGRIGRKEDETPFVVKWFIDGSSTKASKFGRVSNTVDKEMNMRVSMW